MTKNIKNLEVIEFANILRALSIDMVDKANSGHPGIALGAADIVATLFLYFMNFNIEDPKWPNRDRFILSAGHGSSLLYSLLYLVGYKDITIEDLKKFRTLGGKCAGHPEYHNFKAIETTTGPLGQGLANAVGMAISSKKMVEKFTSLIDHKIYVLVGDGCLMEGLGQEAVSFAGHYKLNNLIVLYDSNNITIDGTTDITITENITQKMIASNWNVIEINGNNPEEIAIALEKAQTSDLPVFIKCNTIIGYGSPNKSNTNSVHGSPLGKEEVELTKQELGVNYKPFEIPTEILEKYRQKIKDRIEVKYKEWVNNLESKENNYLINFLDYVNKNLKKLEWKKNLEILKLQFSGNKDSIATRTASGKVLESLTKDISYLIGGSADLTPSNNTKTLYTKSIYPNDFSGRYIHYGIREHAMAAIMNGMALHSGTIPYGGTFLVFTDYMRGAIRMSALLKKQVIYVATHDSIGLGEDGPTHQPVEHLASLRAMPNLLLFRPADAIETIESWEMAILTRDKPSLIALTRQKVKILPRLAYIENENKVSKGGYIISKEKDTEVDIIIIATGSEVELALDVQEELEKSNNSIRVISMPCIEIFREAPQEYKEEILLSKNKNILRVAIEAGVSLGWHEFIGSEGLFIGVETFGVSAPGKEAYKHFGLTKENIIKLITEYKN